VREEVRESGGGDVVEAEAVQEEIHREAEEVREEVPAEEIPAVDVAETVAEVEAEIVDTPEEPKPPLIPPESSHPYFRKRTVTVFGKKISI
jgi:hypothetical protein